MENKQAICDALVECLKLTRDQADLVALKYDKEHETVCVHWEGGGCQSVGVAMDSGIAMIRDILRAIR